MNIHDRDLVLSTIVGTSILYIILRILLADSLIPLLVVVYILGNMIAKMRGFESFMIKLNHGNAYMSRFLQSKGRAFSSFGTSSSSSSSIAPVNDSTNDRIFSQLTQSKKAGIISSIKQLQLYGVNNKKFIDKKRKLFRMMSWRQQHLCKQVGYLDKLDVIDQLINKNQLVLNKVVDSVIDGYQISFSDFDLARNFTDKNSYRVIESLSHFNRDWPDKGNEFELDPVLKYINDNLKSIIPESEKANTCVLVPGSGLGRIPHELALSGYAHVHSIEFSGLMYLFNNFVYENNQLPMDGLEVFPYIHTNSNFESLKDQYRSKLIPQLTQPSNLHIHLEDFNLFEIPDDHKNHKNIVIVTAFFIDTAENLVDYLDTIHEFTKFFKNGYWINIGPLKYGTAPQVELNMDELAQLRQNMGWIDLNALNSLRTPIGDRGDDSGLYSYVTDKKSLWQGYYGLSGWCSKRKENKK